MKNIKSAAIVLVLALVAASAAAVAPVASRLHAIAQAAPLLTTGAVDPSLPTVTIVGKRVGRGA